MLKLTLEGEWATATVTLKNGDTDEEQVERAAKLMFRVVEGYVDVDDADK